MKHFPEMFDEYKRLEATIRGPEWAVMNAYRQHEAQTSWLRPAMAEYRRRQATAETRLLQMLARRGREGELLAEAARQNTDQLLLARGLDSLAGLSRQVRGWTKLTDDYALRRLSESGLRFEPVSKLHATWTAGLTSLLGVGDTRDIGTTLALGRSIESVCDAYSSFCGVAIRSLNRGHNDMRATQALVGSLTLAERHFARLASWIPSIIASPSDENTPRPATPMRLYIVQRAELTVSAAIEDPTNLTELFEKSAAARAGDRILDMLGLIPQVNAAAQLSGKRPVDTVYRK